MANYYATVRTFLTPDNVGDITGYSPFTGFSNGQFVTGSGESWWIVVAVYSSPLTSFSTWVATLPSDGGTTPTGSTLLSRTQRQVTVNLNTTDMHIQDGVSPGSI